MFQIIITDDGSLLILGLYCNIPLKVRMAEGIISVLCCSNIMGFFSVFRTSLIPFLPSSALSTESMQKRFSFSVNEDVCCQTKVDVLIVLPSEVFST